MPTTPIRRYIQGIELRATVERDDARYPPGAGDSDFLIDVNRGEFDIVLRNGTVIPKGVPTYIGEIDRANSYQDRPEFLDLRVKSVNGEGLIEFENVGTNRAAPAGRAAKYMIDNMGYVNSLAGRFFDPHLPLLIYFFHVDPNLPDYTWQSSDFPHHSEFFKSYSLLNFL